MTTLLMLILLFSATASAQMTEAEKQEALHFHNHLRRNVVPRAADMNAMFWSDSLAVLAQKAADTCKFEHNYGGEYANLGENLYLGGRRNFSEILMMMYIERELYNYTSNACVTGNNTKYPMFSTCGHYFQLVTASVMYVGCGLAKCGTNYLAVCEYNRFYTQPPYQTGEPGSKCGHYSASWYYNGLCYWRSPVGPPPINATFECKIRCMNYGEKYTAEAYGICACHCSSAYSGIRCEGAYKTVAGSTDCMAQAVTCEDNGVPVMHSDKKCRCQCLPDYEGERCEVNIIQEENSVFWYFGQAMRYSSYYPVNINNWDLLGIDSAVRYKMTEALNLLCRGNYTICCPESTNQTTTGNFVSHLNFGVTKNYPSGVLDGSMKVGVHFTMPENRAAECNFAVEPFVNRKAVLEAATAAFNYVVEYTAALNVKTLRIE